MRRVVLVFLVVGGSFFSQQQHEVEEDKTYRSERLEATPGELVPGFGKAGQEQEDGHSEQDFGQFCHSERLCISTIKKACFQHHLFQR
jgi:hypothetical protein